MENWVQKTQAAASPSKGEYFATKDASSEALKSSAIGGMLGTAGSYGILRVFEGLRTGQWSFKPTALEAGASVIMGGLLGAYSGFDAYKEAQTYNHQVNTLNKYKDQPDIQNAIMSQTGPPRYEYVKTNTEKMMDTVSNASFWAWLAADYIFKHQGASNALMATSCLTAAGCAGAHMFGVAKAEQTMRQVMSHAEKLALQREAVPTATMAKSA